ncbi:MAG TPA: hypothetical protein VGI70_20830, partial [Polyangiales bacterium]
MKCARIVLLDDDRAAVGATQRLLLALEHALIAVVDRPSDALAAVERDAPDVLLINARSLGERTAARFGREVSQRFGVPCVLQSASESKSNPNIAGLSLTRVRDLEQLSAGIQIALCAVELEREQRHATEADARAAEATSAIRSGARLIHQLNNLLS